MPGGRVCFNIANLGRRPYLPLHRYIIEDLQELGFLMRGEIIWDKAASAASSTAWGSWKSPTNPTLRDVHEYILFSARTPGGVPSSPAGTPPSAGTISWSAPRAFGNSRQPQHGASATPPHSPRNCPAAASSFTPTPTRWCWTRLWAAAPPPWPR